MNPENSLGLEFEEAIDPRIRKPNTIYHVGVSGGKDSAAVLLWVLHKSGIPNDQIEATFCDTGNEHAWTYAHVEMLSKKVFPIETLNPELDFFELALDRHRFPSTCARFCTEELKIIPTQLHIAALRVKGFEVIAVSGVRGDESDDRSQLPEWGYSPILKCFQWRPLIKWSIADVFKIHEENSVPLNPLYACGAQRVGCYPCVMSRKEEIRNIALRFPERIDAIRKAEQAFEKHYGRFSSFFAFDTVPPRFRSKLIKCQDGREMLVATIDDVVKWSMTGDRAKGSYLDDAPKETSCNSGYCE